MRVKIKNIKFFLIAAGFFLAGYFIFFAGAPLFAQNLSEDDQEELETLEEKAEKYKKMIELSRQQQTTLQNQLKLMQLQEDNFSNGVAMKEEEINKNKQEAENLENQISRIKGDMERNKNQLAEIIRAYNKIDQEITMEMLSNKSDLSDIFNRSAYLNQASSGVEKALEKIQEDKKLLDQEQAKLQEENDKLEQNKKELEEKVYYLNNEQQSKNIILEKTKGEEGKYKALLSRIEQQKMELLGGLDELSETQRGEIDDILKKAKKPKEGLASTKWYYAQDNPKWGNNRIGLSSSLLKDYGCAVTSLAMIFTYYNEGITPGKLASQPIFYQDLIVWPQYWKGIELTNGISHGGVDWNTVRKEIKNNHPVIVFVRASGGKGHYVVIHGRDDDGEYVVHDPLFGANIYLETTKKLVSAIYGSSTVVDQALIYHD